MIVTETKPSRTPIWGFLAAAILLISLTGLILLLYSRAAKVKETKPEVVREIVERVEERIVDLAVEGKIQAIRDRHNEYINRLIEARDKVAERAKTDPSAEESYNNTLRSLLRQIELRDSEIEREATEFRKVRQAIEITKQPVSQEYLDKLAKRKP
jgi:hypothetical protein